MIFKPGGSLDRGDFSEPELRTLLRQAIVAIAAAIESYVAEKARSYLGVAFNDPPVRLRAVSISLGDVIDIEKKYERRQWGYREVVEEWIAAEASASPSKIGIVFSTVGKKDIWKKVDAKRKLGSGAACRELEALCKRRNQIAHTGDRVGRKRATLAIAEVQTYFDNAKSIVEAMEAVL